MKLFKMIILLLIIGFFSCETNPIVDRSKLNNHYYVYCLLSYKNENNDNNYKQALSLTRLRYAVDVTTSKNQKYGLENAKIKVISEDSIFYFANINEGYYETELFAEYGKNYRLEILTPDGDFLFAEITTPDTFEINNFYSYDTVVVHIDSIEKELINTGNGNFTVEIQPDFFSSEPFVANYKLNTQNALLSARRCLDNNHYGGIGDFDFFCKQYPVFITRQIIDNNRI